MNLCSGMLEDEGPPLDPAMKLPPEIPQYTPQSSINNEFGTTTLSPAKPSAGSKQARYDVLGGGENHTSHYESVGSSRVQHLDSDTDFFRFFELKSETLGIFGTARQGRKRHGGTGGDPKKRHVGRAILHEAFDKRTMASRVVKIIDKTRLPASAGGDHLWRRLCRKLLQLSARHAGLMTVTDVFESPERFYIVTENLQGGELFEFLLHEKAVPEELCKYIIKQILHALDFLHSNSLLHRDVKPENLMFRRARPTLRVDQPSDQTTSLSVASTASSLASAAAPRPMSSLECSQTMPLDELSRLFELAMIDFDTCKMTDVPPEEYNEICNGRRRLVGTYGYLAPEVLRGHEYTRVSDLWSVGVILYILMTGVPPVPMDLMVSARASLDVLQDIRTEGIDFMLAPFPEFPKAQDLCRALLEFDPAKRIASARLALAHPWLSPAASNAVPYRQQHVGVIVPPLPAFDQSKRKPLRPIGTTRSPKTAKYTDQNAQHEINSSNCSPFFALFNAPQEPATAPAAPPPPPPPVGDLPRRYGKCRYAGLPPASARLYTPRLSKYALGLLHTPQEQQHSPPHTSRPRRLSRGPPEYFSASRDV